ncbi:ComF family protein [Ammoniphilus sp. CFH 90114]|uniref:ComF family protein n=1 Tax=Ammoniphilus sp. CFH 90114 TaxID=2493665 RepID=UPI00100DD7FC|nr:ComF family protein [Ammoniphilus sp. CFH 90114]RXT04488.1 ComF family protein [Ammoniphilus sp. CFH 90114]
MRLLNLLYPVSKRCAFCERRAVSHLICRLCDKDIHRIGGLICSCCGKSVETEGDCEDCQQRPETFFLSNRSAVQYNDKVKEIIGLYKYRGRESLSSVLGEWLVEAYRSYYSSTSFQAITFVPIHEWRLQERGFNQAQQLAVYLSLHTKIPLVSLLSRTRSTEKQSKQHRAQRLQALQGAFQLRNTVSAGSKVLLVDDIYTTGSTVNECARILAKEGAKVYALTVAR